MPRKPRKPPLSETHPELLKQWHPSKNGELSPEKVSKGSNKKVWWKCPEGDDHEWEAIIALRTGKGYGCTICSGYKVVLSTCLATKDPKLAKQWHPTKNGGLTQYDLIATSRKKVWWKCPEGDDHEWEANLGNRYLNKTGCPICNGNKVVKSNCISTTHPEIVEQIDLEKNKGLDISKISIGYTKKIWWKCDKGEDHKWYISPSQRVQNDGHVSGCPYCSGVKVSITNSLKSLNPKLAEEWHPTKNGKLTPSDVTNGSSKKVWWKCHKGIEHEWKATIKNRQKENSFCPFCIGRKVSLTNNLLARHPEIAKEWHPTKNGTKKPEEFTFGSQKKVWWKCPEGDDHEWEATIGSRTGPRKTGCSICHGLVIVKSNCLQTINPELAKEWHPLRNGNLTPSDVAPNSQNKVWWKCSNNQDHEWEQTITNRNTNKSGCPFCDLTPQSRQELIITFELLKFFKDINPKGYKTKLNGRLRAIDIFIPDLNLAIEFDGSYWHKDKRAIDKIKSEMLIDEGYQVIRIREQPLKKIHENDIISKLPYNGKEITDNILKRILELYSVKDSMKSKIHNYFSKDGLQNEKALDKYIDQILEEKASRKK